MSAALPGITVGTRGRVYAYRNSYEAVVTEVRRTRVMVQYVTTRALHLQLVRVAWERPEVGRARGVFFPHFLAVTGRDS